MFYIYLLTNFLVIFRKVYVVLVDLFLQYIYCPYIFVINVLLSVSGYVLPCVWFKCLCMRSPNDEGSHFFKFVFPWNKEEKLISDSFFREYNLYFKRLKPF